MPTCLSVNLSFSRKSLNLLFFCIISPLFFYGQSLTGLWVGTTSNDSTTVRKDQSFEIALTEYRGKVYGYSRSEFIVDEVLYYVVKRVKGTIEGDICEVTDDEIIAFNFPTKLDKGVKVTSTFRRNRNDSTWHLEGTWKTSATKKYYAVTGTIGLEEEKDLTASKIFPHLEELKLANDVAFYRDREEGIPIVKIAKPEKIKTGITSVEKEMDGSHGLTIVAAKPLLPKQENIPVSQADKSLASDDKDIASFSSELPVVTRQTDNLPKTESKTIEKGTAVPGPVVSDKETLVRKPVVKEEKEIVKDPPVMAKETMAGVSVNAINKKEPAATAVKENPVTENKKTTTAGKEVVTAKPAPVRNVPVKEQAAVSKTVQQTAAGSTNVTVQTKAENKKEETTKPAAVTIVPQRVPKPEEELKASAAVISGRKSEFTQVVNFRSDSLVLSLYDNGEIDGDTVSVFLNGEIIMARQGLKASAIKKTIYIKETNEDFTLVLFADNLGKYPPNTGLLVVHDGEDIYNLRFSSDFQRNAGIIFRRKIQ